MATRDDLEVKILKLLNAGGGQGLISGGDLSAHLGISRTAVWKHIRALRALGFLIEAIPSRGYRLKKGRKDPFNEVSILSAMGTDLIGRRVYFYDSVPSTNTRAFELGRTGEPEGAVVIADSQTMGKGRLGRSWISPPGVNLYTSVILRPDILPQNAHNLTFLSAVAVAEAVSGFCRKRPTLKWPNDVLIAGRKVSGILLELASEADKVNFVVAGIGVNINTRPGHLPPEIRDTAASIMDSSGSPVSRLRFAVNLYSKIEKWYKIYLRHGFPPVLQAWKGFFDMEGRTVSVHTIGRTIQGRCMGVDSDGSLLVKTASGPVQRIISGDMSGHR
jgi:BirA family biotin operon repressor/biotin-[acetyl-CoA-carboxylase] ligase